MRHLDIAPLIIDETDDYVVINKPADWPTTGRNLDDDDCLQFQVIRHYGAMVWSIHQLDADTSGICVFVRTKHLVPLWKEKYWSSPNTVKRYLAMVHGSVSWRDYEETARVGKRSDDTRGVVQMMTYCTLRPFHLGPLSRSWNAARGHTARGPTFYRTHPPDSHSLGPSWSPLARGRVVLPATIIGTPPSGVARATAHY